MLKAHRVELLIDVRTVPKSRHNPQFNRDALAVSVAGAGIGYEHMPGLGGLRHARKDSFNTGWKNLSFRGYADYMQTAEFARNIEALLRFEPDRRAAIMCAESLPWRCHRSLIADALAVRGISMSHIMSPSRVNPHQLTSFAHVEGINVTYPAESLELFGGSAPAQSH